MLKHDKCQTNGLKTNFRTFNILWSCIPLIKKVSIINLYAFVHLVTQSCPTLCDPMDCSPPGSSIHGDSPGKNSRVGCHVLLQEIFPTQGSNTGLPRCGWILYYLSHLVNRNNLHAAVLCLVTQLCPVLCYPMGCSLPGSSVHGDSSGQNSRMGCHALLQRIFPTQGSNTGLPHCRKILYHLSHLGSVRILEWVAYPFSRGSSWSRNQTKVSCIAGRSLPAQLPGKPNNMHIYPYIFLHLFIYVFYIEAMQIFIQNYS